MRMTLFFFYMNRDVIFFSPHFRDVETPVQVFDVKKKKKIRVSMTNHFQRNNYSNAERNFHSLKGMR